jgi:hypothetical protein
MTLQKKTIFERSRDNQKRARDLRGETEELFTVTKRLLERARQLARIIKTKTHKNAIAMKKAS